MADAKRIIELIFEGVDKTGAATQAALNNTQKFASNVQTATQPIADFTTSAVKLEATLLATGLAMTAFSIKAASDFQFALGDLQKVLADTDDIEQYRNLALDLSDVYGVAALDVLQAITNYKQAGFTAEEAGQLTKAGLDMVIAGSIEAARGAELLVASIKGFGAEAKDSSMIVDLLNSVSNEYAATTQQLLEGFAILSPVASAAGLSLQETIGILTPGIEVFQSGSEVANALRTSLLRLVDDSKPVQEGLAALGVSQHDANGELRSARDIYFDVAHALQGVDDNQRLYLAGQLVGIQRSSQFLAITDGLDKTLRIAGDGFDFLGSAAAEVALQLGTAEVAGQRAKTAFMNMFIHIGTPLLDEATGIADAITLIFKALGESARSDGTGINQLVTYIEGELGTLQSIIETVAQNLPAALNAADMSGFTNGVTAVTSAIRTLFDGVDLTTVKGLTSAIEFVGAAFNGLSHFTAGVIESFKPLFEQITKIAGGLHGLNPDLFKTAGEFAGFATQANILSGALVDMLPALQALVAVIGINQAAGLVGSLTAAGAALGGPAGILTLLGKAGLVGAAGAAGVAIGALANDVTEFATGTSISTWATDAAIALGLLDDEASKIAKSLNSIPFRESGMDAEQAARSIAAADAAMEGLARGAGNASDMVYNFSTGLWEVQDSADRQAYSLDNALRALDEFGQSAGDAADATKDLDDAGHKAQRTFSVVKNEFIEAADATTKLSEAAEKLQLEEKLAIIEARSHVMAAQIDADARKVEAAYESINVAIESTGDAITELYGLLGDESIRKLDKIDIRKQIEEENARRQEAFDLQTRLTEAQIAEMRARRDALNSGGGIITVNGDGLQPHLEAFMFEILSAIQVRVNAAGEQMLLGLP